MAMVKRRRIGKSDVKNNELTNENCENSNANAETWSSDDDLVLAHHIKVELSDVDDKRSRKRRKPANSSNSSCKDKESGDNWDCKDLQVRVEKLNLTSLPLTKKANGSTKGIAAHKYKGKVAVAIKAEERCGECLQFLDDSDLVLFSGDDINAVDEVTVLTDKRLSLFTGSESSDTLNAYMEHPQHKITMFSVYDTYNHLCRFDTGLMERNVRLYFSGYVQPIYSEDASHEGGIPAKLLGPINEWWIAGFDGGERALIGFSTEYADYILMEPSVEYKSYMQSVMEKIHMAKVVIEFISNENDASFEDLLEKIQSTPSPDGLLPFTQDALLTHAQFIIDQISSYDSSADEDERLLLTTPCIRSLIRLAGVTLTRASVKRKPMERREKVVKTKCKKPVDTKATTTNLVHDIIGKAFADQMEAKKVALNVKTKKCGVCAGCQQPNCGKCSACVNGSKRGGKKSLLFECVARVCLNAAVQEAEEDDASSDDDLQDALDKKSKIPSKAPTKHCSNLIKKSVHWFGNMVVQGTRRIYKSAKVNNSLVTSGDFVLVEPQNSSTPFFIAKIKYLYEDEKREKMFHALWFIRGTDTILGETSDENEIFMIDECDDIPLSAVSSTCQVYQKSPPPNWFLVGGEDDVEDIGIKYDGKTFFYQKWYDSTTARFEDPIEIPDVIAQSQPYDFCSSCYRSTLKIKMEQPSLGNHLKNQSHSKHTLYSSVAWHGQVLNVYDCIMLDPSVYKFKGGSPPSPKKHSSKLKAVDEELYPEKYRKSLSSKGTWNETVEPFCIGRITAISTPSNGTATPETVSLTITVFYRPENTCLKHKEISSKDVNMLYWSSEETRVKLKNVVGKCDVVYGFDDSVYLSNFASTGLFRFYFTEAYDSKHNVFEEVPSKIRQEFSKKDTNQEKIKTENINGETTLRALDIFAGCGGLSDGFIQTGVCETCWAIENDEAAATAFEKNHPKAIVFAENCNTLLKLVMEGKKTDQHGQALPQKGEVDIILGGPPCQGFSGMNRFNYRQYSLFKNSLIATFLSYCDYYRPKYFILENVRNFVAFKKGMVLKLTLRCLVRMGYQCTFGILQAGNYGVPQTRRRTIILAAAPGEKLPQFPEPYHVFPIMGLSVMVDEKKYVSNIKWLNGAPFRGVTVLDSMSDLPPIENGASVENLAYTGPPKSSFQKMVRQRSGKILKEHICKEMSSLVEARIRHIPLEPGSDWRDLPNICVELSNGQYTKKLKYMYNDLKNGKSRKGLKRGVCPCAEGKPCDSMDRQSNTLIPWCLPHTGSRHAQWGGLYGRLRWDGHFFTTVTNPEPMGKQGCVVHPEQHRVVSVRECARSQGFSDSYMFFGTATDRHKQIGNAVPPPLASAIALELKKCLAEDS